MTDIPFFFDPGPVAALQELLGLGWPGPWQVVTLLGSNWGILLALGIALWLYGRRVAYGLLVVVALDSVLKAGLNQVFDVARPDDASIVKYEQVDVSSFPSGHQSTATAIWGWLALRTTFPWTLAILATVLVGISRLYLGLHYVGDILGGILLAVIVLVAARMLWPPVQEWLARRSSTFWIATVIVAIAAVTVGAFTYFGSNPYRWRAGGLVAGLAIGLFAEWRWVRYEPGDVSAGRKAAIVAIGLAGIAIFAAADLAAQELSSSMGFFGTAAAALWTVFGAPTLFSRLGWSATGEPRRERLVHRTFKGLGIAVAIIVAILVYGAAIEPRLMLDVEEHTAEIPGLPPAWTDARVAVVSDFQLGMWLDNTGMMRRSVEAIVDARPAVAVLAGDFIYHPEDPPGAQIGEVMDVLRPLIRSGIPTVAVLGNHDWGMPRPLGKSEPDEDAGRMLRDSLESAGIAVLHNRAIALARRDSGAATSADGQTDAQLWFVGVGSRYADMDRPKEALAMVPADAPRFVVMHNPQSFPGFPGEAAPLAVAGHTHGGQVRLPFTPEWSWLTFTADESVHADGWVEESFGAAGNRLYVTRGIGMSLLPIRINSVPEVAIFRLVSDRSRGPGEGPDYPDGVDETGHVPEDRQDDADPEVLADPDLQENADRRDDDRENGADDVHVAS